MSDVTRWWTTNAATNDDALVVYAADHDRVVAELRVEVEELKRTEQVYFMNKDWIATAKETIARQAKVIEKLKEQRDHMANRYLWATGSQAFETSNWDKELEAIEQGEET